MSTGLLIANAPVELRELAQSCDIALWDTSPAEAAYVLRWQDDHLELAPQQDKGAVWVDFVGGALAHRRKFGGGRGQPVAKAVGIKGDYVPRVLDCTAGQGRDAFVLASLGCHITLLERSPIAWLLLHDGLRRAREDASTTAIAERMTLIRADAKEWFEVHGKALHATHSPFPTSHCPPFDVVFLDPMFPEPDKRAKSKKEMAAFQALIGGDPDADALLAPARQLAGKRVVVKRPRHAPHLAGVKPNFVFEGESTRFDGYLPA